MLGGAFRQMLVGALGRFNDGKTFRLHFVTAREMANIAFAAIDGRSGNAGHFRDFRYLPVSPPRTIVPTTVAQRHQPTPHI